MGIKCLNCEFIHNSNLIPVKCENCGNTDLSKYERVTDKINEEKHLAEKKYLESLKKN